MYACIYVVDPLSYFSFQPVFHDWCNKGRGMCYPVCGMMHICVCACVPAFVFNTVLFIIQMPQTKRRPERTLTQRFQKNRRKAAPPPPPKRVYEQNVHESDEEEDYENAEALR